MPEVPANPERPVAVTPRPSSTLVQVRQAAAGGLVDASDRAVHEHVHALDDAAASTCLRLFAGGLDYWMAKAAVLGVTGPLDDLYQCQRASNTDSGAAHAGHL